MGNINNRLTKFVDEVNAHEVTQNFGMLVPIYLDYDGKVIRLGNVLAIGSSTSQEYKLTLPQKLKRVLVNDNYDVLATESESIEKKIAHETSQSA